MYLFVGLCVNDAFLNLNCRQVIVRARNLRAAANFIPLKAFRARKAYFTNEVCLLLHLPSFLCLVV